MKKFGAISLCCAVLALSACTSSSTSEKATIDESDQRHTTLLAMNPPDFYGTLAIAQVVGNKCPDYRREKQIDYTLNDQRMKRGNGAYSALFSLKKIRAAQHSMSDAFLNKHGTKICSVVARDFARGREPYTYFLVPSS